ncbi:hypothetical protein [Enterococcus gallinarum]|uniref:hypothetical protein n=1 Tax=Enterococcus gallinarum TaxID=1353 RepID=UPI0012E2A08F|nr:hypothetical protein [Enterococcus gallinarum]MUN91299.1 hypothetical protein [Enterococcus gallinarum]
MVKKAIKKTFAEQPEEVTDLQKRFRKADLLKATRFTNIEADFLGAYLNDEPYTLEEAKQVLIKLRKEKVK